MGRELKRVPLDFNWPINKVWEGYINPHYEQCPVCKGSGSTMAMQRLEDLVSLLMLSGSDAMENKCHPYFYDAPLHNTAGKTCGKDMTELTTGLAGREPSMIGYDGCDKWSATKKIIKVAGLPKTWGICPECKGNGIPKDKFKKYDTWKETEPPKGKGFQLWETTSEGSPQSPVFATLDELCVWASINASTFADCKATAKEWKKMLGKDDIVCHKEGNMVFM